MTSTVAPSPSPEPAAQDAADRRAARLRVFRLLRSMQVGEQLTDEAVRAMIAEGERRAWPDVVRLAMFLGAVHARFLGRDPGTSWIEMLLQRATDDGDSVTTAMALAMRAQDLEFEGGRAPVEADRDLARAAVLLEGVDGPCSEAVSAHIECALACERRDLWELQLFHYAAAERCLDPEEGGEDRRAVLLYNLAEVELNWVASLRERGEREGLADRAAKARAALRAADVPAMPESWREDLHIFGELIDAIAPVGGIAPLFTRPAEGEFEGCVHLTRALAAPPGPQARAHVDLALATIDRQGQQRMYLLALALAVELEAAEAGRETAGLRWGRELVARRWERRLATLASMESLIAVERKEAEHALLQQHAYLDDLTGLANRRGLVRFIDGLRARGSGPVAVALIDLDRFKQVNDTHGHAAGDSVLSRTAEILRRTVREQDLVVRLGGDEFLVLLTTNDRAAARRRCETIVETVAAGNWGEISGGLRVRASVGMASGSLEQFDELCTAADEALYRAKQAGGAQLCL